MVEAIELRKVYCELLLEAAEKDPRVVVLDADLMRSNGTFPFRDKYPERSVDVGVAEANMIGVAAGMASVGKIPFAASFCTFASRRCFDQIFVSAAYAGMAVKICGTDPGIAAELNGGTHMSFEDIGILRSIPEMVIVEPVDSAQLKGLFNQIKDHAGPVYIRMFRKKPEQIYKNGTRFTLGKCHRISDGKDATIFATGIMVKEAKDAAALLAKEGIYVRVENMHTIKPIDEDAVKNAAMETGAIVTAENHNVLTGLAGAVSEVVVRNKPVPMEFIGVQDKFGQVGKMDYLKECYGLRAADIVNSVKIAISRK